MLTRTTTAAVILFAVAISCVAEDKPNTKPRELQVLKDSIGVWDAEIEVWPAGLKSPSIKFKGVETNRAYGQHWIASDFDSVYMGQKMKIHSIVGYDLDRKKLVGTVIDHGPYSASMTGEYDAKTKTVHWRTTAKTPDGKPMLQNTSVTHKSANERILVLKMPGQNKDELTKFMKIRFVKRK